MLTFYKDWQMNMTWTNQLLMIINAKPNFCIFLSWIALNMNQDLTWKMSLNNTCMLNVCILLWLIPLNTGSSNLCSCQVVMEFYHWPTFLSVIILKSKSEIYDKFSWCTIGLLAYLFISIYSLHLAHISLVMNSSWLTTLQDTE